MECLFIASPPDPHLPTDTPPKETQALENLLSIEAEEERHRYRHARTEQSHSLLPQRRRSGKENHTRRQVLPKLNSSKEELKQILKRLEGNDYDYRMEQALQPLRSTENAQRRVETEAVGRVGRRAQRNENSWVEGSQTKESVKADDIRLVIRRNNYSANALNLKTLSILHELNSRHPRCASSLARPAKQVQPKPKNMIAYLKRHAP